MWKTILNKILEFLKANTGHSSLRLMAVGTVVTCCICLFIVVISEALNIKSDWIGAAVTITAIGGIIGVALWGKNAGQTNEKPKEDQQ